MKNVPLIDKSVKLFITPEIAYQMLKDNNNHNRKISRHTVNSYSEDMKNGRWIDNGIPITICIETNDIADGQHRLAAVVQSGISQFFTINYLPSERCNGFDMNRVRSTSDILLMGRNLESNMTSRYIVSIANVLLRVDMDGYLSRSSLKSSAFTIGSFIENNQQLFNWWLSIVPSKTLFRAPECAAIIAAYKCGVPENAIKTYIDFMCSGYTDSLSGRGWYQARDRHISKQRPFISESNHAIDSAYNATQFLIHCVDTNRELKLFRDNMVGKIYYNFNASDIKTERV